MLLLVIAGLHFSGCKMLSVIFVWMWTSVDESDVFASSCCFLHDDSWMGFHMRWLFVITEPLSAASLPFSSISSAKVRVAYQVPIFSLCTWFASALL